MIDRAYHNLHYWIRRTLGTPKLCENCGTTDSHLKYEWANISGNYLQDTSDWARLCKLCHNLIDKTYALKQFCKEGHEFTPANVYINSNGNRVCRECRRISMRDYQRLHQKEYRLRRKAVLA